MRYVKLIVAAAIAGAVLYFLGINYTSLNQVLSLRVGLPFLPLGKVIMPVWVALLLASSLAFLFAIILDMLAWYQYERLLRLQRQQIRGLQDALEQAKSQSSQSPT